MKGKGDLELKIPSKKITHISESPVDSGIQLFSLHPVQLLCAFSQKAEVLNSYESNKLKWAFIFQSSCEAAFPLLHLSCITLRDERDINEQIWSFLKTTKVFFSTLKIYSGAWQQLLIVKEQFHLKVSTVRTFLPPSHPVPGIVICHTDPLHGTKRNSPPLLHPRTSSVPPPLNLLNKKKRQRWMNGFEVTRPQKSAKLPWSLATCLILSNISRKYGPAAVS